MNVKKYLLATIVLSCLAPNALADENKYSKQFTVCEEKAQEKIEIQTCISKEFDKQDARLNKAYKKLLPMLSEKRKKILRNVQRTWIKYRDENCGFYYDGYSMHTTTAARCSLRETASRATELEKLIKMHEDFFYTKD